MSAMKVYWVHTVDKGVGAFTAGQLLKELANTKQEGQWIPELRIMEYARKDLFAKKKNLVRKG